MTAWLERQFALAARGSSVRSELIGGVTTFLTMAYIVAVNPLILGAAGMPPTAVAVATCVAAAFGSLLMGWVSNYPLAMAPGMGLNAYFTYTVVKGLGVPWPTALGCVFLSGLAFLLLTLSGLRQLIVQAIPRSLLAAVAGGIGLFIAFIGLADAGIIVANSGTLVGLGHLTAATPALALLGILLMTTLQLLRVRGAVLIGIVLVALLAWLLGVVHAEPPAGAAVSWSATFMRLDVRGALSLHGSVGWSLVEIVFVFLLVDLFDNIGTLTAVTRRAGLVAPDGTVPRLRRILIADSVAMMVGAVAGTSPVTSYIESAAGVAAGARTGLSSVVVALLFGLTLLFTPLVGWIPTAATAPALILVGALMMAPLAQIDWSDPAEGVPAFLTVIMTVLSYSIANGLAFGLISHALIKLLRGQVRGRDTLLLTLAALFVLRFLYLS